MRKCLASSPAWRAKAILTSTSSVVTSQRAAISVASISFLSATFRRLGTVRLPETSGRSAASGARRASTDWFRASSSSTSASAVTADLVILLVVAEPVLVPLGQVRERGEVPHAVEVDDTVEVIGLVLDDAREELLCHGVDRLPVSAIGLEAHRRVPGHHAPHV